jgi:hypothetical protein
MAVLEVRCLYYIILYYIILYYIILYYIILYIQYVILYKSLHILRWCPRDGRPRGTFVILYSYII